MGICGVVGAKPQTVRSTWVGDTTPSAISDNPSREQKERQDDDLQRRLCLGIREKTSSDPLEGPQTSHGFWCFVLRFQVSGYGFLVFHPYDAFLTAPQSCLCAGGGFLQEQRQSREAECKQLPGTSYGLSRASCSRVKANGLRMFGMNGCLLFRHGPQHIFFSVTIQPQTLAPDS